MNRKQNLKTIPQKDLKKVHGVSFPKKVNFRQLIFTGPPGAGKSVLISKIRGWPLEGYIDLSQPNWWHDPQLTYRPRELHLGIPFLGHEKALAVFDKVFMNSAKALEIDLSRIQLPPEKKGFFSTDWRRKFAFEFVIVPPKKALRWRKERSKSDLFHADKELSLEMVKRQNQAYLEAAFFLHKMGFSVHIREGYEADPKCFSENHAARRSQKLNHVGKPGKLKGHLAKTA